ncbi:CGLAU_01105 family protein [Corynebacterium glutamicum]|uniref:CGLAU_01105 family protein n=1 Tax=Corynebacterium glutamicum TaxID=1718 RepID=UPI000945318A|nr:CGLAU_01105 family protein [Corynebacterium glutamicum]OKX79772.1 hypothetical protein AUO95_11230 [Corynebacterium glutamicum]
MSDAKDDSILSKWGNAASELGEAVGDVAKKVRDEFSENDTFSKLKAEASEAVDQAKSGSYLGAGKEFARDAGSIIKDAVKTVKGAVSGSDTDDVKSAFGEAVEASRDKFDDTLEKRKAKKDSQEPGDDDIIDGEVIPPQN